MAKAVKPIPEGYHSLTQDLTPAQLKQRMPKG